MLILNKATIATDDAAAELALDNLADNGRYRVVHTGDTLTVSARNEQGRWTRVDFLRRASRIDPKGRGKGSTWSFQGISDKLVSQNLLPPEDAVISFSVEGQDGCPTCH